MSVVTLAAPAKINLYLEVLGKREDGFHGLETVFQTLWLADTVRVERRGGANNVSLTCSDPTVPNDAGNLAWRAAEAYLAHRPDFGHLAIMLEKRIPHGAGLGGGSSDAAAVLRACRALDETPLDPATLAAIALELGSDVPVFLLGGTAHATGRGEVLTPLPDRSGPVVAVCMPNAHLPTPSVFKALSADERGPRLAHGVTWAAEARLDELLHNRLTAPARRLCPQAADLLDWLALQQVPFLLSGSGAACFALGAISAPPVGIRTFVTRFRTRADLDVIHD